MLEVGDERNAALVESEIALSPMSFDQGLMLLRLHKECVRRGARRSGSPAMTQPDIEGVRAFVVKIRLVERVAEREAADAAAGRPAKPARQRPPSG